MAIRRLNKDSRSGFGDRKVATISTLPTVKAMVDCFERYLNLTIADAHASNDTVKTYRSRVHQFLSWCQKRERSALQSLSAQSLLRRRWCASTVRSSLAATKTQERTLPR